MVIHCEIDSPKICTKCHLTKNSEKDFYTQKYKTKDGVVEYLASHCKDCQKRFNDSHRRKRLLENPEKERAKFKKYKANRIAECKRIDKISKTNIDRKIKSGNFLLIEVVKREIIKVKHETGISQTDIASLMNVDESRIRRIMGGPYRHSVTGKINYQKVVDIDTMERMMLAVGKQIHDIPEYYELNS